ncbi:SDR family oxidoreductase [Nocardioides acrostichi]|uniref:SDR family oxidoreductase n=1 Tax=Nocardioides acrostichi TaxID=2784339 RepID=A0A930YEW1_9ACTN|nr:SDR family oxidoreductase [Nocardioides acrostichi]MBF4163854.1 SDR family oxidoreductase [Nocardioides acrostichi]
MSLFDLHGRTALVTGSSRGIGLALADGLAGAGARVVVHGRDVDRLSAAVDRLAAVHGADRVQAEAFDVADPSAVEAGIGRILRQVGDLDVLVNNAGLQHREPLLEIDAADWQRVIDADLTSVFLVGRAVARGMVARGSGKIVNVGSVQTSLARPGIGAYAAAKGGVRMLTQAMCAEWGGHGVQVNAVAPGYLDTDMTAALVADPDFDAWLRGRTPAGRWGAPSDLVGPVLFLASQASDYVGGQVLYVDGGLTSVV